MAVRTVLVPGPRPVWPPVVVGLVRARRKRLVADLEGRVLELGDALGHLAHYRPGAVSVTAVEPDPVAAGELAERARRLGLDLEVLGDLEDAAATGPFDAAVSVLGLPRYADLPASVAATDRALRPDGTLRFAEPVARPGVRAAALATAWSVAGSLRELHLHRDVPSAIRARGYTVVSIERFTMPTVVWPLRPFAVGEARRIPGVAA